ncbi:MAG: hypothetical protein UY48_C0038G0016 [Candidatus Gottesmanbacteria bacterium GW2011_GWB1_49_7]|uniref:Uncharacterized protein n=1 Tax=Candidatus Gottesmanbacteria bacterium GW2011_GWB1_49_7 TaxID=1618448 RepID=A0A0G1VVC5_9BACT|nr:MAG: hypothetical protein UY48_C0038G0016 [Candidatus Gottesmanbacteria bacterium GW2011_GWB1_49_7]
MTATELLLIEAYRQLAEHTKPKCGEACNCQAEFRCCEPEYCNAAIQHAKEYWNVDLPLTRHPTLPGMGLDGCVFAPHFRPLCTAHNCFIGAMGFIIPPDSAWNKRYFALRDQIVVLEDQRLDRDTEEDINVTP